MLLGRGWFGSRVDGVVKAVMELGVKDKLFISEGRTRFLGGRLELSRMLNELGFGRLTNLSLAEQVLPCGIETGGVDLGVTDDVSTTLAELMHTAEAADEELTDPVDGTKLRDIIESQSPSNLSKKS